jgi:hypothetical protein
MTAAASTKRAFIDRSLSVTPRLFCRLDHKASFQSTATSIDPC